MPPETRTPVPFVAEKFRVGRRRKAAFYLEKIRDTGQSGTISATDFTSDFEQMQEELQWAWKCFRDDALARDICWKYACAVEAFYAGLTDSLFAPPISKRLLIQMCERGIEAAELIEPSVGRQVQMRLAGRAAQLNLEIGQIERAATLFDFAIRTALLADVRTLLPRLYTGLAETLLIQRRFREALEGFSNASALADTCADAVGKAYSVFGQGKASRLLDDRLGAAEYLRYALQLARNLQKQELEAAVLQELGDLCLSIQEFDAAIKCYEDSIDIIERLGRVLGLCSARTALGNARLKAGDLEGAARQFETVRRDATAVSDLISLGRLECGLGIIAHTKGDFLESRRHFETAIRFARQCGDSEGERIASNYIAPSQSGLRHA